MKLNLGCGPYLLPGFRNMDPLVDGWTFQEGLPFPDGSVESITASHAFHVLREEEVLPAFRDCYRVLQPGGILRITDDDTENPASKRHRQLWHLAKHRTGPEQTRKAIEAAGFTAYPCTSTTTKFKDDSLCIAYRALDYVYFIEGVKP